MHSEVSVPDFIERQEMDDYYNQRAEEKMRLFVTAMASLTEKQHKYLVMRYVDGISARDIIARHVYETHGFQKISSTDKSEWGEGVIEERWELRNVL